MLEDSYTADFCYKVGTDGVAGFDEWIDFAALSASGSDNNATENAFVPKYVTVWTPSGSFSTIQGLLIEYNEEPVKLSAPSFNLKDGASVYPGSMIKVFVPTNANTIVYSINGGEEVSISSSKMAFVRVDTDSEIVAYAKGDGNFLDSDKVTLNLKVESLGENVDYACASNFLKPNGDTSTTGTSFRSFEYSLNNGSAITTKSMPTFSPYRDADRNTCPFVVNNTTPYDTGISKFQVYYGSNYPMGYVYVQFSDTAPVTEITDEMLEDSYTADFCYKVGTDGVAGFDEWIDFTTLSGSESDNNATQKAFVPKYVTVWTPTGSFSTIQGLLIEYNEEGLGIDTIGIDEFKEGEIYNLSGLRMTGHNLTPGIYLRKDNGKIQKILVK